MPVVCKVTEWNGVYLPQRGSERYRVPLGHRTGSKGVFQGGLPMDVMDRSPIGSTNQGTSIRTTITQHLL